MITEQQTYGSGLYLSVGTGTYSLPARPFSTYNVVTTSTGVLIIAPQATTFGNGLVRGGPVQTYHVSGTDSAFVRDAGAVATSTVPVGEHFDVYIAADGVTPIPYDPATRGTTPTLHGVVAGGGSTSVATTTALDHSAGTWSAGPAMNVARAEGAGAGNGQGMYIAQDRSSGTSNQDRIEALRPVGGSWSFVGTLNDTRVQGCAAPYRSKVMFYGGDGGGADSFELRSGSVAAVAALPYKMTRGGAVAIHGRERVMLMAGEPDLLPHLFYHGPSDTYESLPLHLSTTPVRSFSSFWSNGLVHKAGGYDNENSLALTDHDAFDPVTRTWATATALGAARYEAAAFTRGRDGQAYVAGGLNSGGTAIATTQVWTGSAWGTGTSMSPARSHATNQAFGGVRQ